MAMYSYEAKFFNGKKLRGSIEADSEAEARVKIRAKKLIPIKISSGGAVEAPKASLPSLQIIGKSRVKPKDLQVFTRQLSVLIQSGIPLFQALEVLSESPRGKALDFALKRIVMDIAEGKKLGTAFQAHPNVFSPLYVSMLVAGETGGVLDQVLNSLARYIEKSVKLNGKIKGAMVLPAIVLSITLIIVLGLMVFVIPTFEGIFNNSGMELPAMTQLSMSMSHFVIQRWYLLLLGLLSLIIGVPYLLSSPQGKLFLDQTLTRLPLFGSFVIKGGMARFSRTFSTLLAAGVSIMDSLTIASSTCGNSLIEKALLRSKASVAQGKLLSTPLSQEAFIPHMVVQMIAVGEQTGALDEMLNKVADFYEDEVDVAVDALTTAIEPLMFVFIGGIVGFFVISLYLPIFNMPSGF